MLDNGSGRGPKAPPFHLLKTDANKDFQPLSRLFQFQDQVNAWKAHNLSPKAEAAASVTGAIPARPVEGFRLSTLF